MNVVIGATIVVGAGLFTLWRSQVRARQQAAELYGDDHVPVSSTITVWNACSTTMRRRTR